ncbi:MAG: SPOR domain-containing protein [Candidatus Ratteibacteria bacterium]|nr:SPOR domain-containing protein [Candidatus Ratteibacteria bacterium]
MVKETKGTAELSPIIEAKTEPQNKVEIIASPKEIPSKIPESSNNPPAEKPAEHQTAQGNVVLSEFYTIQVATFSDMRRPENLAGQLKEKNFSPVYIKTRGKLFEVCVGKFSNPQEGQDILSKIKKDFHDAFIRKMQPPFEEK